MRRRESGTKDGMRWRFAASPSWTAAGNSRPRPVRRPRAWFAATHPGGVGAPPEANTGLCQELADGGRPRSASVKSAARRRKEFAAMARRKAWRSARIADLKGRLRRPARHPPHFLRGAKSGTPDARCVARNREHPTRASRN